MSDNYTRFKKSMRRARTNNTIRKQLKVAKWAFGEDHNMNRQPHRMAKHHALDCGQPNCNCCGNPRRISNEKTMQERRFDDKCSSFTKMFDSD